MRIRIEATELPGRTCPPGSDHPRHDNVHVGVQRRERPGELLDLHPGDAASAAWTLECATAATAGGIDITGRYVQGRPGDRFIYLSWGTVGDDGAFTMFRRAKLMLDAVDPDVAGAAARSGRLLARVRLTDPKGEPLCARVRPPYVEWSAA
ncbi:DUF5990 family protein [Actinoallomurus bryophytorum]|uniref:DUF5990 family protein n=1 Tax=Actinoallomurus bryophytorum TaxID=1490222 RepID=UPI00114F32F9|nr:DUF5990 family protein [Actinoallomurus bryophytorum]